MLFLLAINRGTIYLLMLFFQNHHQSAYATILEMYLFHTLLKIVNQMPFQMDHMAVAQTEKKRIFFLSSQCSKNNSWFIAHLQAPIRLKIKLNYSGLSSININILILLKMMTTIWILILHVTCSSKVKRLFAIKETHVKLTSFEGNPSIPGLNLELTASSFIDKNWEASTIANQWNLYMIFAIQMLNNN